MKTFIGNNLYASYKCHLSEYVYTQNDDLRSIVYMLLHLYTGTLPWDKIEIDYSSFSKSYLENFHSKDHSLFYNLKKNTKYDDYYKSINKYDENVERLIYIYDEIS
jgi:hypothetical protein